MSASELELVMGIGPMNLVITNDALYRLSYTSKIEKNKWGTPIHS